MLYVQHCESWTFRHSDTTAKSKPRTCPSASKNPDGHMTYKKVSYISVLFEDDSTEFGGVVLACALNGINAKMIQLSQLSYLNSNIFGHE